MQQYNCKTCFWHKTKRREDFNADPLSIPTILRTSKGSSTSEHHSRVASRGHQQVHRHNKRCAASTSTVIVSPAQNAVIGNAAVSLPTGDCVSP